MVMFNSLISLLSPPAFEDDRQTYAAQILNLILLVTITALTLLAINNFFVYGLRDVRPYTAVVVLGVLLATLIDGVGLQPKQLPRPVVNTTTLAPPATIPVTLGGSKPGVSMTTKPFAVTGSAYS